MQSTIQPGDPAPSPAAAAEFLTGYLHRIHLAQSDALAILQRVMIQSARLLDDQPLEKPYQTRSTNERMRIAMRSAATIINMRLPRLRGEPAPSPSCSQREGRPRLSEVGEGRCSSLPSPVHAGEGAPRSSEGRMRVPFSSSTATTTLTTSAASSPLPAAVPTIASPIPSPHPLGTRNSALTTSAPPLPSSVPSVPSVSSVFQSPLLPPPSSVPPVPLLDKNPPPPPPDLTFEERASIYMTQQGIKTPFNAKIADKLRAWHLYTEKYGIKPPFDYTPESLLPPPRPRKPRRPRPPPAIQNVTLRQSEASLELAGNNR